jgi:hypothetical protein
MYDNNNSQNYRYLDKITRALATNSKEESLDLEYDGPEEKEWMQQWKLRTSSSDQILEKIISKIQKADKGQKIEKMQLKKNGIYVGKYKLDDVQYPIAIYSEKDQIDGLTKIVVNEVSELKNKENSQHIKAEETFIKYLVIAFYEDGINDPVLMIQIEKFDMSKLQNTKEKWLEFLNILVRNDERPNDILITADWISQFSSEIKGRACHWCSGPGKCCNEGTPCSTCPENSSKLCCNVICNDTTLITTCDSCKQGNICDENQCKSNNCCYQACLSMIEKFNVTTNRAQAIDIATLITNSSWKTQSDLQANAEKFQESVDYVDATLASGKPVIIGVHYNNNKKYTYNAKKRLSIIW